MRILGYKGAAQPVAYSTKPAASQSGSATYIKIVTRTPSVLIWIPYDT